MRGCSRFKPQDISNVKIKREVFFVVFVVDDLLF